MNIVDAAAKLTILTKVVDADKQSLAPAGTVGVLESVTFGGPMAELLRRRGRRRTGAGMGGVAVVALRERVSVRVEAGRWRVSWGRVPLVSGLATVALGGRRSRGRSITVAAAAASVVALTRVVGHIGRLCAR